MIRLFFATDVHGSNECWHKCVGAVSFYKADVVVIGGDLTGKAVVPVIREPDGTFTSNYLGVQHKLKNESELKEHKRYVSDSGFYPHDTTPEEIGILRNDQKRVDEIFEEAVKERLRQWIKLADEKLQGKSIAFFVAPGNDDQFFIDPIIEESEIISNAEGKILQIDEDHEMLSSGWSNPTPWQTARECSEDELEQKIEAMATQVKDMRNCIFNLHAPPYDSGLDMAPKLDENLRRSSSGAQTAVGSTAVRKMIEKYQPLMGLHGHIHEARGTRKIGRTLCLNPGSNYTEGLLSGCLLAIDKKGIRTHMLTSG